MSRKRRPQEVHPTLQKVKEYIYILLGSATVALSFNLFLILNKVASGGLSEISIILHILFAWVAAYVQYAFNIPLFIAGVISLAKVYGARTLIGTLFLTFVVYLSRDLEPATVGPLL